MVVQGILMMLGLSCRMAHGMAAWLKADFSRSGDTDEIQPYLRESVLVVRVATTPNHAYSLLVPVLHIAL